MQTDVLDPATGELSEPIDPNLSAKERDWLRLVNEGRNLRVSGEMGKWGIGDKAHEVAVKWDRQKSLRAYAVAIGLSHPRNIDDYLEMAEVFDDSARAYFYASCPNTRWSHYRDAARWANRTGATPTQALGKVIEANDNHINTHDFAAMLRENPNGDYVTKRWRIGADLVSASVAEGKPTGDVVLRVPADTVQTFQDLRTQRAFRVVVMLVYEELKI